MALLKRRKMLVLSQFRCKEVTSYHSHFISVLTHRRFQLSPTPKLSSQILLSHGSPFCFTLPQSVRLATPTLGFLKSLQTSESSISFNPSGSTLALLFFSRPGSLVCRTCWFSLVIPCPPLSSCRPELAKWQL